MQRPDFRGYFAKCSLQNVEKQPFSCIFFGFFLHISKICCTFASLLETTTKSTTQNHSIMTHQEFTKLTKVQVSASEYEAIESVYMNSDLDKFEFCAMWCKMTEAERRACQKALYHDC